MPEMFRCAPRRQVLLCVHPNNDTTQQSVAKDDRVANETPRRESRRRENVL